MRWGGEVHFPPRQVESNSLQGPETEQVWAGVEQDGEGQKLWRTPPPWETGEGPRAVPAQASGTSPGCPVLSLCDAVEPTWGPRGEGPPLGPREYLGYIELRGLESSRAVKEAGGVWGGGVWAGPMSRLDMSSSTVCFC